MIKQLLLKQWRFTAADLAYYICDLPTRERIDQDVYRYLKWNAKMANETKIQRLNYCLYNTKEFRNVFFYRIQKRHYLIGICKAFLKPADCVEIGGEIEGGLYISHRNAVVFPKKAGKNLRVGPGVVIGKNRNERPTIGDNVYIASNTTVIGGIHIGNNVIIGAGSVVTKDIPSEGVYAGNPARLIRNMKDVPELYDEIQ